MAQPVPPNDAPSEFQQFVNATGINVSSASLISKSDPDVWQFGNPLTAIWTGGDATKVGYYTKPLSKAKADFYNLSPDELLRFQEMAFQAGLYGPTAEREDIAWKARDKETLAIWSDLNDQAALAGKAGKKHTIWDRLQDLVDNRPENVNKNKKGRQPLVTKLPDPREIEEMIRGVAPEVIGRDADDVFISEFTAMYRNLVQNYQEQVYALSDTEKGGTVDAPPSAEALAAHKLRTENPGAYEELRGARRAAAYTQLLKGIV